MPHREEARRKGFFERFEKMGETQVRLMDANPNLPPVSKDIRYSRVWLKMWEDKKGEESQAPVV